MQTETGEVNAAGTSARIRAHPKILTGQRSGVIATSCTPIVVLNTSKAIQFDVLRRLYNWNSFVGYII